MASTKVSLPKQTWTEVTSTTNGSIRHMVGHSTVIYIEAALIPTSFDDDTPTMEETTQGEHFPYWGVNTGESIFAYAVNDDCVISVTPAEV